MTPAAATGARRVPGTLWIAVVLTGLEGLTFAGFGLALLPDLFGGRPKAGATALVFFLLYAVFLLACAWHLGRLHSWARAPVVLAQLIQVLIGFGFWSGDTRTVAVVLVAVAVVVLVAVLHPRSTAALGGMSGGSA